MRSKLKQNKLSTTRDIMSLNNYHISEKPYKWYAPHMVDNGNIQKSIIWGAYFVNSEYCVSQCAGDRRTDLWERGSGWEECKR